MKNIKIELSQHFRKTLYHRFNYDKKNKISSKVFDRLNTLERINLVKQELFIYALPYFNFK